MTDIDLPTKSTRLSDRQIQNFQRDGFLIVRGLLAPQQVQELCAWTDEIASYPEVPGKYMMYFESSLLQPEGRLLNRMENFCPYHAGFAGLVKSEALLGCVSQLFGEPAVLFKDKINFKLPGGSGFEPHQDVQAGWDRYARLHLTALVSIDPSRRDNGCLEIVAGHHQRDLIGKAWRPLSDEEIGGMDFIQCGTEPGDAVFFDSYTPHRSGPNTSANPRRVLYLTYNRLSEGDHRVQYYADKRRSYPPDCERIPGKEYVYRV